MKSDYFWAFLPIKEPMVVTISETWEFTSRRFVAYWGMNAPKLWERHKLFWWHFSVFALKKLASKMLMFWGYFLPLKETLVVTSVKCVDSHTENM